MPARIRFRSPGVKPGQKIGPLGPFRGRLGLGWVVAPLVLGVVLAVAGWAYLRGGVPPEPWRPVGSLETMAPGSVTGVGDGVMVARLPSGDVVAVAPAPGCELRVEGDGYLDCEGRRYALDGTPEGPGEPLDLVPIRVVRGTVYADPARRIPR